MLLYIGTWDPAWGHTWVARGFGKVYALRSLAGGSSLCLFDESTMTPIGEYRTPGEHSCHITLLERQAVVSDYTSGTLSLFPLDRDGIPSADPEIVRFEGSGPVPGRQERSHVHSSWLAPDGQSIVVVDLGADSLTRFKVEDGQVDSRDKRVFRLPAGTGPRHCAFGKGVLYVATELSDEVLVLSWPGMKLRQRCLVNSSHPGGGGHLALSPDGNFLYVSSRLKDDRIVTFKVEESGILAPMGYVPVGSHPRHFCLSPDGALLFVACRDDDLIQLFERNPRTGGLVPSETEISVSRPVFIDAV